MPLRCSVNCIYQWPVNISSSLKTFAPVMLSITLSILVIGNLFIFIRLSSNRSSMQTRGQPSIFWTMATAKPHKQHVGFMPFPFNVSSTCPLSMSSYLIGILRSRMFIGLYFLPERVALRRSSRTDVFQMPHNKRRTLKVPPAFQQHGFHPYDATTLKASTLQTPQDFCLPLELA